MSHINVIRAKRSFEKGFTFLEIMTVVCIIALLAALCIPNFMKSRDTAQTKLCIDNLRVLDGAKQQWALENKAMPSQTPLVDELRPYLVKGEQQMPICPADLQKTIDTSYDLNNLSTAPKCKIEPAKHFYE